MLLAGCACGDLACAQCRRRSRAYDSRRHPERRRSEDALQAAGGLSAPRARLSPGLDAACGRVAPPQVCMPEPWPVWSSRHVISVRRNPYTSLPENGVSAHKLTMPGPRNLKAEETRGIH
jgi:hypothetical protein